MFEPKESDDARRYSQLENLCNLNYRSHNHHILIIFILQPELKVLLLVLGRFFSYICCQILLSVTFQKFCQKKQIWDWACSWSATSFEGLFRTQKTTGKCFLKKSTHHFSFELVPHGCMGGTFCNSYKNDILLENSKGSNAEQCLATHLDGRCYKQLYLKSIHASLLALAAEHEAASVRYCIKLFKSTFQQS